MKSTIPNIRKINLFPYRSFLKDNHYRRDFLRDITFLNFTRLRFFGYFIVALTLFQLYFDIFLGEFWETYQLNTFMIFDIILLPITIFILVATHFRAPKSVNDIKPWHEHLIYGFILFQLLWTTGISVIEAKTANSLPTFLLGVFTAATLFILRGFPFFIMLLVSLVALVTGLIRQGLNLNEFVTHYLSVLVLIILAWIISRVLYGTRIKSYHATKTLENARNDLDRMVKERTAKLRETNVKLQDEINERKRYEVFLEIEKKKAEEADRLKSVFLANMSHEIRTPLNGLLGFSDLLQASDLTDEKRNRYIEIIQSNGEQLLKIIDDILDISMIESNQLKVNKIDFHVGQIFPDALAYFTNLRYSQNKEHIEIINLGFEKNASDLVFSDPSRIQQVLYNLLNNALKFTTEGSIKFGGRTDDGYVMLFVEDTGIGLDVELCDTIFERFRQGEESISRAYGGTGLGLSISKGIIELMGGLIWVDYSYTQGARFCFTIPSKSNKNNDQISITHETSNILTEKEIIISDNDPYSNTPLTYLLKCSKSNALCLKPEQFQPGDLIYEPVLIVLDIMDDPKLILKLTHEITKHLSRTKILAICNDAHTHREKFFNAGCSAVLRNPLNYHVFLLQINKLIGKSSHSVGE